jgi:1-acyl-sn-glycerol-3-phosphate acyltransferase
MLSFPPMGISRWIVTYGCKLGLKLLYRVQAEGLGRVPREGPLLLFSNHTGKVEGPIMLTHLAPRMKISGLMKAEMWKHWFLAWVFNSWEVIPVRRGEGDRDAVRRSIEMLENGYILGIAPEGTRSRTGGLIKAHGGVAFLALHSGAPIQAIAHWGGEDLTINLKRLRRTDYHIRVGPIFRLDPKGNKVTKQMRQEMADEMMYQLAILLPEEYRGEYSDIEKATDTWLHFEEEGSLSSGERRSP